MLQGGMGSSLVEHLLQGRTPSLDKVTVEPADCLLIRGRWNNAARAISMKSIVQPKEVSVSALDLELWLLVRAGCCLHAVSLLRDAPSSSPPAYLGSHRVHNVGTGQVAYLDGVANSNIKARLSSLLHAHAGLRRAPKAARPGRINRRRCPRPSGRRLIVVVINVVRIGWPTSLWLGLGRHGRPDRHLLLLRRGGRSFGGGGGLIVGRSAEGPQRIVNGFEASRLCDEASGAARGP